MCISWILKRCLIYVGSSTVTPVLEQVYMNPRYLNSYLQGVVSHKTGIINTALRASYLARCSTSKTPD